MITDALLTVNPFSRPGTKRVDLLALVMHWTGVPMQPASEVREFFEERKFGKLGYGSAHYVVDLDGTILRMIPEEEIAYHCGSANTDPSSGKVYTDEARWRFGPYASDPDRTSPNVCTIGIEMCPIDAAGDYRDATLSAAIDLAADVCKRHGLDPLAQITTHHDIVGWKDCPRLWVNHPELLESFKQEVKKLTVSASAVENERTGQ